MMKKYEKCVEFVPINARFVIDGVEYKFEATFVDYTTV